MVSLFGRNQPPGPVPAASADSHSGSAGSDSTAADPAPAHEKDGKHQVPPASDPYNEKAPPNPRTDDHRPLEPPTFTSPGDVGMAPAPIGSRVSRRNISCEAQRPDRVYSHDSVRAQQLELNDAEGALVDEADLQVVSRTAEEEQDDPFLVDFSPNDPDNPRNFPLHKKWYVARSCVLALLCLSFPETDRTCPSSLARIVTAYTSALCFCMAIGSSMPTGDLEGAAANLHVAQVSANLSITLFVAGFGFGPMLFAPLSEFIGRRPVYIITGLLYWIFNFPCAIAQNLATLLAARMIAGLAASAPMTNVGGTLSDIWKVEEKGIPMAIFSSVLFLGPAMGPLVGGWIATATSIYKGWRWIYWTLFAYTFIMLVIMIFVPETLGSAILKARARRLRKKTGDDRYKTAMERTELSFSRTMLVSLYRPFEMLIKEAILTLFSLYLCLIYSLLYLLFFAFPIVFAEGHGFSEGLTGTTFMAIVVGILLALLFVLLWNEPMYKRRAEKRLAAGAEQGNTPEDRLPLMMIGATILPIGLFIFAWTSMPYVPWEGACIGGGVSLGFAFVSVYLSANNYLVDVYPSYAASALAAKTLLRSLCASAVPLFVTPMYHHMRNQWASTLLAFVAVGMLPIPFFFYMTGAKFRASSQFAAGD